MMLKFEQLIIDDWLDYVNFINAIQSCFIDENQIGIFLIEEFFNWKHFSLLAKWLGL